LPRQRLLTSAERTSLLALPSTEDDLIRHYTFSEPDKAMICQRRGEHNRLGFAVLLCALRYPGIALPEEANLPPGMVSHIALQLHLDPHLWKQYAERTPTRREHLAELQTRLSLRPFTTDDHRSYVQRITEVAQQTDRGMVLAEALVGMLRADHVILPSIDTIERVCSEARTQGIRHVYAALTVPLTAHHRRDLDALLTQRPETTNSELVWLRQPPGPAKPKHILLHLDRLRMIRELGLPDGLEQTVHQNRMLKLAREGGQMTAQHLRDLDPTRRYATLVALVLETRATVTDTIIDLHDHMLGVQFSAAKRTHVEQFHQSGKSINDKVRLYSRIGRALLKAKQTGSDPYAAIEAILPWPMFSESVTEAERLMQGEEFDFLPLLIHGYNQLRRYTPTLLEALTLHAAPAARKLLEGVEVIKAMNRSKARTVKVPADAPLAFVRKRWRNLVHTADGLDRKFYELCVLTELRNALRSGDIWVECSRQFKDFESYLMPVTRFVEQREHRQLGLAVDTDCERFLESRRVLLERELASAEQLAAADELPDATMTDGRLSISPLDDAVPEEAKALMQQAYSHMPHLKITELLLEVDGWTKFTRNFTHMKTGVPADDQRMLLTTILSDAINLGLRKMTESCPGATYAKLSWMQSWCVRDETYTAALATLVNAQHRQPFAAWWGDGTTSSSDGQNFKAGGRGRSSGDVNLKYGQEPGVQFYTHISDRYAPFHIKVISATVRDATYVLDGLLYHESDIRIEEHYTDTAGFTDQVFGLMHLVGYRFSPRIRDLADKRLFIPGRAKDYPTLSGMIGGKINWKLIREHWDDLLRLAGSIKQGTVTASLMLRKLGSYPRQNGLAVTLRELGRIERTLFTLNWMQHVDVRRRSHVGLNKGEAKNALSRAVFINRLGEIRDRGFEDQCYRASGLNLVVAAIVLWNTVYLERVVQWMRDRGHPIDDNLLQHLSPLGWEHINLTGDYIWRNGGHIGQGRYRPLRKTVET